MEVIFSGLQEAVGGAPLVAMGASFVWGVLSILLSPCHLASIPLIVGFIDDQGRVSSRRVFFISSAFALGILITIAAIGTITAAAGRIMGDIGPYANYLVSIVFLLIGLHLLDVLRLPFVGISRVNYSRKGVLAAFVIGLIFGIALGPCTFAFMAPVLAAVFKVATTDFSYGVVLLLLFALGHCAVIVAAGLSTGLVQRILNWNEKTGGGGFLKKVCGGLVILAGLYLLFSAG